MSLVLFALPNYRPTGDDGLPLPLGKLYLYYTGTLGAAPVYDADGNQLSQPITADITGLFASFYLDDSITYRAILQTAASVEIKDIDPFNAPTTASLADPLNALDYIPAALRSSVIDGSNTTALTTYLQAALDAAKAGTRPLFFPKGTYKTGALTWTVTSYFSYFGAFGAGPKITGEGIGSTIFETTATGWMLDVTTDTVSKFALGGLFSGFSIKPTSPTPATCNGIRINKCYNFQFENLHIYGLNGTGIKVLCSLGDTDSTDQLKLTQVRIDSCTGWGFDCAADDGHNEISFVELDQTFIQGCGVTSNKTITGISNANPAVVTANAHGHANGDTVMIFDVAGMTSINDRRFTVAGATTNTFQLSGVDSSAYGAWSSGGKVSAYGGGMIWKGQICSLEQAAFALNNNVALFIPGEAGLAQTIDVRNTTFENNLSRHLAVGGIDGFKARNIQFYNADAFAATVQSEFNGSTFALAKIDIDGVVIRATSGNNPCTAFMLIEPSSNTLNDHRVSNVIFENFGYTGQVAFSGWCFDPVPMNCKITTDTTHAYLIPVFWSQGNKVPYRQAQGGVSGATIATGPWVTLQVPAAGYSISNATIGNTQTRNLYLYDGGNLPTLEVSTTAPAEDALSGYQVKTGEAWKLWVGRCATDGGGLFLVGVAANWVNPLYVSGAWQWANASGNAFMKAGDGTYSSLPTSDTDGVKIGSQ